MLLYRSGSGTFEDACVHRAAYRHTLFQIAGRAAVCVSVRAPATTAALTRSGSHAKGGLHLTSRDFELEIETEHRRALRITAGAPGATSWAFKLRLGGRWGTWWGLREVGK